MKPRMAPLVLFIGFLLVAPAVLTYALRRTRAWWVGGAALAGFAMLLLVLALQDEAHIRGARGDWGNGLDLLFDRYIMIFSVGLIVYAAVVLFLTHRGRKSRRQLSSESPAPAV
jgi:hypothetical protein